MVLKPGKVQSLAEIPHAGDYNNRTISGIPVLLSGGILLALVAGWLKLRYALPLSISSLWFLGTFVSFYIPGYWILRWIRSASGEFFQDVCQATAIGMALTPVIYSLFRRLNHPDFLFFLFAASCIAWIASAARDARKKILVLRTSLPDIASVSLLLLLVLVLLHLSHFTDVILLDQGFKIRSSVMTESDFHLGIVNALSASYPPSNPYASGTSLSYYHMNLHLGIEMLHRMTGIDALRLLYFYFPLLYLCLLAGVAFYFVRMCRGPRWIALLTAVLVFGSDLSFIPGILNMVSGRNPWVITFYPAIWSLFTLNGHLPAVIALFLCVGYLKLFYERGDFPLLLLFGVLAFSSYGFKSTMGVHIITAATLTGGVSMVLADRKKGALVCAVSLAAAAGIMLNIALLRNGMGGNITEWAPLTNFYASLRRIGIRDLSWNYLPLFLLVYIVALLGPRLIWIPLANTILKKDVFNPTLFFILAFTLSGIIASDMIYLGAPSHAINNSVWFAVQSLTCAWLLIPYYLERLGSMQKKAVCAAVVLLLAAPGTVQFIMMRVDRSYIHVDKDAVEVVDYLKTTPPESVVLHGVNKDTPSLSANFAGRSVVASLFRSFVSLHLDEREFRQRLNDILYFFSQGDPAERSVILDRYHVDYVYASRALESVLESEKRLSPVLKNHGYVLYAVKR